MQSPRRFLPSLALLSAFEAAARTGSVRAATRELPLTQGVKFDVAWSIGFTEWSAAVSRFLRQFIAHGMITTAIDAEPTILR